MGKGLVVLGSALPRVVLVGRISGNALLKAGRAITDGGKWLRTEASGHAYFHKQDRWRFLCTADFSNGYRRASEYIEFVHSGQRGVEQAHAYFRNELRQAYLAISNNR